MRIPLLVIAAAAIAVVIAAYDAAVTYQQLQAGTDRPVAGTLVRDAILVLGAVLLVARVGWSRWLLVAFFALTLVRVYVAIRDSNLVGGIVNALAVPGLVILLLPAVARWMRRDEPAPVSTPSPQGP